MQIASDGKALCDSGITYTVTNNQKSIIDSKTLVSMNMIAFPSLIFDYLSVKFIDFLKNANLEYDEFLIPDVITNYKNDKLGDVDIISTNAKWVGVTYKEDKEKVKEYIDSLIKSGIYKNNLWS